LPRVQAQLCRFKSTPMQINNETVAVLWVGAGAVLLWMFLPAVLNALGLTLRKSVIDDHVVALEPSGNDAEYEELFSDLRRLGFEPVGRRSTTCWFFLHHWYRNFQSRVFAAQQGDGIALAYKLRVWDPWRLCFVTAFSDGAIVQTANQMERFRINEPDHLRWGLATPDRALLLEQHREVCRDFAAVGSRSVAVLSAEQVNQLNSHHESRYHRKRHRLTGLNSRANSLWCLGFVLLLMSQIAAPATYVPASIIAWGFLWPAVHALLFRASATRFRVEDARRHLKHPTPRRSDAGAS
jgi:hypothetical protein